MSTRDEIAAAANTVAAVTVQPFYRQSTKPGDGWVRRDVTTYPNKFGGVVTWQVLLILPHKLADAEKWIEDNQLPLVTALRAELIVSSARPAELAIDSGTVPVLLIEGQREED